MRRFVAFGPALLVLLAVLAVVVAAPAAIRQVDVARIAATVLLAQNRLDQGTLLEQLNVAMRDVADATLPGVVHVQVLTRRAGWSRRADGAEESRPQRLAPRASGAGWIYNDQGFVVTNAHVIDGADEIRVELHDGRSRRAEIVGVDPYTDIAVVKIDPSPGVVALRRATGVPVSVGDQVFAFGSPFSIKFSMSRGIVSGLGRSEAASFVGLRGGYTNFIQTDAAINPGNSGGPLVDVRGRVVGMNAAIANNAQWTGEGEPLQGQSAGIGFAIPLETIDSVVEQLISANFVLRGYLGVELLDPQFGPDDAAARFDVNYDGPGVLLTRVAPGQPADRAGLRVRDVVVQVDGQPTPNSQVLRSLISIRRPGDEVPLRVWREGEFIDITVRLGAAYNERGVGLTYIPGSENMPITEVRRRVTEGERRAD